MRAWSTLQIKSVNESQRLIEGWCSTPSVDRDFESISPLGLRHGPLPLPLLFQHRHDQPCGQVLSLRPSEDGVYMRAKMASVPDDGADGGLAAFLNRCWAMVKNHLVAGLSIGFLPIKSEPMKGGKLRHVEAEVVEISIVTIPSNADCGITTIKSLDLASIARNTKRTASPKSYLAIWLERMVHDANCALFKGRHFKVEYHSGPTIGALAYPRRRAISFHEQLLDMPDHKLMAIAIHELCHLACAGEREEHGPSWRRAMQMRGVDPDTGAILHGSPARHFVDTYK